MPSCAGGPSISSIFPLRNRGKRTCRNRWSPISKTCRNSALGRVWTKGGLCLESRGSVVSSSCRFPNTRRQRTVGSWSAPFLVARRYVCRVSILVRVRLCAQCTSFTFSPSSVFFRNARMLTRASFCCCYSFFFMCVWQWFNVEEYARKCASDTLIDKGKPSERQGPLVFSPLPSTVGSIVSSSSVVPPAFRFASNTITRDILLSS